MQNIKPLPFLLFIYYQQKRIAKNSNLAILAELFVIQFLRLPLAERGAGGVHGVPEDPARAGASHQDLHRLPVRLRRTVGRQIPRRV